MPSSISVEMISEMLLFGPSTQVAFLFRKVNQALIRTIVLVFLFFFWKKKFENSEKTIFFFFFFLKSQCHTKRRIGAAMLAHPSFCMITTRAIRDLFAWRSPIYFVHVSDPDRVYLPPVARHITVYDKEAAYHYITPLKCTQLWPVMLYYQAASLNRGIFDCSSTPK